MYDWNKLQYNYNVYLYTQTSQIDCFRGVYKFCDESGLAIFTEPSAGRFTPLFEAETEQGKRQGESLGESNNMCLNLSFVLLIRSN